MGRWRGCPWGSWGGGSWLAAAGPSQGKGPWLWPHGFLCQLFYFRRVAPPLGNSLQPVGKQRQALLGPCAPFFSPLGFPCCEGLGGAGALPQTQPTPLRMLLPPAPARAVLDFIPNKHHHRETTERTSQEAAGRGWEALSPGNASLKGRRLNCCGHTMPRRKGPVWLPDVQSQASACHFLLCDLGQVMGAL